MHFNDFVALSACPYDFYIINSVLCAFWLVLSFDLLKDRFIDDDSTALINEATSEFASVCIGMTWRRMAIFMSLLKWGKDLLDSYLIKTYKILYDLSLDYMIQEDSMLPCVCSVVDHRRHLEHQGHTQLSPRVPLFCSYHILSSSVIYY